MLGGAGSDRFIGGLGSDVMTGGTGQDTYAYSSVSQSSGGFGIDRIVDFTRGQDRIDITAFDARASITGNQVFTFTNGGAFNTGLNGLAIEGQVTSLFDAATNRTVVSINTDTDLAAEMTIRLDGNSALTGVDFIL